MFIKGMKALFGSEIGRTLVNGVLLVAVSIWGYYQAYESGFNASKLALAQNANQTLSAQLMHLSGQIEAANRTHLTVLKKIEDYQIQGEQTTDELQKILAKTASRRVDCRFDADSLQRLDAARKRAVDATARGFSPALSDAAGAHGR